MHAAVDLDASSLQRDLTGATRFQTSIAGMHLQRQALPHPDAGADLS